MSAFAAEYMELRGQIVNHSEKYLRKTHLKILIDKFQPIINSKRLSSYVNNFNDLITILEKRSYVGEHNVGPFTEIVQLLPNADILSEMLSNFQTNNNRNRIQGMHMNNNGKSTMSEQIIFLGSYNNVKLWDNCLPCAIGIAIQLI